MERKQHADKEFLYREHIILGKPMSQIAKECGVSGDTIRRNMIKCNIKYWTTQYREKLSDTQIDKMAELYCIQKLSANEIGKIVGCTHKTVIRVLQNRGVHTRDISQSQFAMVGKSVSELYNSAEWLNQMYWIEGKTTGEIAKELGVAQSTVLRHMKKLGLRTKSCAEAKSGQLTGDKHPNWQGGITPLKRLLRQYFQVNQLPVIAKRDGYTCQLCGASHTILNVHHIRAFSEIVDEIVSEHKELDTNSADGRLALYQVVISDSRFLDEGNLITFCKDCHYFKIHNYQRKKTISSQASITEEGSETIPEGSTP